MIFTLLLNKKVQTLFFALCIGTVSVFTLFQNYHYPNKLFWDENYHIASAEKYLQGRMFMECHPPLGKLLIAAGEAIFAPNTNIDKSSMIASDHLSNVPEGISFIGYRFFPVLFAMGGGLLLYGILLLLCGNPFWAFAFSLLYLLDNAILVHFRSAMLDGIQLFFIFSVIICFLLALRHGRRQRWYHYSLMAFFAGLAVSVKLNGVIIMPLFLFLFFYEYSQELRAMWNLFYSEKKIAKSLREFIEILKYAAVRMGQSVPIFFGVILLVFSVHTALGKKALDYSTYKASASYVQILDENRTHTLSAQPTMIWDNLVYIHEYHEGVPTLTLSNPGENGSYPLGWPFGNKSINYRWEKNGESVRYLYLQGNPLVWSLSLVGFILTMILVLGHYIFKTPIQNRRLFNYAQIFLFLYVFYMLSMLQIDRVMYLYHYLIPLQFANIMLCNIFTYGYHSCRGKARIVVHASVFLIVIAVFKVFIFFSPLTYYQPLTHEEISARSWNPWWRLEHVQ